ncbi:ion channel [Dongshaea marina]|uniref:ion channel n=1 Tax=Dongshaea marina TaxID=2047966 RepID=UPI000D3E68A2|nr:ion channel [Dongshaea marina]
MTPKYCQYHEVSGHRCHNEAGDSGYCYWHDGSIVKDGKDIPKKLEEYAKSGGLLRGIRLARANLQGVYLVRDGSKLGYDLTGADLYRANLQGAHLFKVKLDRSSLMKADLREANIHCASIKEANLLGIRLHDAKIDNIKIGPKLLQEKMAKTAHKEHDHALELDCYQQAEEIYRSLRKAADYEGIVGMTGLFTRKELTMRRMQLPLFSVRRMLSKLVDLLCGYGEEPIRVILFSMLLIFTCALFYFYAGIVYDGQAARFDLSKGVWANMLFFSECLYYSVVTFTTLGYGDFIPIGSSRMVAAIEAFTGSFTIALFVVVFVKKMTR